MNKRPQQVAHRLYLGRAWFGLLIVWTCALGGCGYSHKPLYSSTVSTVWVPIFENKTFYRELELQLTEALKKQIIIQTGIRLANSEDADTILQGSILDVEQKRLSRTNVGNLPQEMELRVVIDVVWKDLRTGKILRERKGLEAVGRYIPTRPIGEQVGTARQVAVSHLANAVVSAMRDDW